LASWRVVRYIGSDAPEIYRRENGHRTRVPGRPGGRRWTQTGGRWRGVRSGSAATRKRTDRFGRRPVRID